MFLGVYGIHPRPGKTAVPPQNRQSESTERPQDNTKNRTAKDIILDPGATEDQKNEAMRSMINTIRAISLTCQQANTDTRAARASLEALSRDLESISSELVNAIKSAGISNTCRAYALRLLMSASSAPKSRAEIEDLIGKDNIRNAILDHKNNEVWARAVIEVLELTLTQEEMDEMLSLYGRALKDMVENSENEGLKAAALSIFLRAQSAEAIKDLYGLRGSLIAIVKKEADDPSNEMYFHLAIDLLYKAMENGKTESETIFEEMRGLLQKLVQGEIAGVHARVLLTEFLGIVVSMGIEPAYAIIEENIGTFISSIKEIKGVPGPDQLIAARFLLIAAERGNDKALDFAEESLKEKSLPEAVKFLAANILAHAARKGNNRATIILIGESGHPNVGPEIQQMAEKSIIIAAIRTGDAAAIEFVWTGLKNTPNHRILYSLIESLFYLTKEDPARGAKEIAVFEDVLFDSLKSDMPTDEKLTHLHKLAIAQIFADAIQHDTGELLKKLENRVAWLEKEILSESPGKLQIFLVDILVKLAGSGSEKALSCIKGMLSKMFDNDDKAYQSACLKVIGGLLRLKDGEIFQHLINDQDLPQKVRDLLKDLKELNIRWPERFYYSDLEKIIRNRKNIAESGLKTVVLYPVDDSNFAFTSQNDALSQLCDQRAKTGEEYAVVYYECSTDIELIDALKNCTQKGKTPAYQIIIGGHGAGGSHLELDRPDTTEIGRTPDELEHFYLDLGDKDQLLNEGISNCLSDNGRVVFVTCYGAQGRGGQVNLPNAFRDIFPQAKHILAPDVSTNLAGFTFDEEGGISSVSWKNLDSMANNSLWFFFGERKIGYDAKNPTGSYDMSKGGILSRPIIGSIRDHIPQFRTVPNNRRTF